MKNRYAFKMLLRSPVKTLITLLLLSVASFLFLYNLSGYLIQIEASKQVEESCRGVLTVEHGMVRSFLDTRLFNAFMLSDPTNPAETYGRYLYEDYHHQPLTQEEVESLASLPYVDSVDKRYMTAGVSAEYVRLDTYREFFSNSDRCVIEATVLKSSINEEWAKSVKSSNGKNNNYSAVYDYTLSDVTMLAGDPQWLETQLDQYAGHARVQICALLDELLESKRDFFVPTQGGRAAVDCLDYDVSLSDVAVIQEGRRYVFVLRVAPYAIKDPMFYMGDDFRKDWWPYIADVTDLPEDYLETEDFAPLRELIRVINDDLHTFDVVYTDDMESIRRVTQEQLLPVQGRFLTPEDEGSPICVVSEALLKKLELEIGDEFTLKLGNKLMEQYVPAGARAITQGRYADEWTEQTFTIVGSYQDIFDRNWIDRDLYWSYGDCTIFVPSSYLPATCDVENHVFRPAEVSFIISDAWNIVPFIDECIPQIEAMGLQYVYYDGNWPAVAEKMAETRFMTLIKLIIFSVAAFLAVILTLYLFLHRRRKEYAVLRALGSPRRAAAQSLWLPLLALSSVAVCLGLLAAWSRSEALAANSLKGFAEAGLSELPPVRFVWFLLGALGVFGLIAGMNAVYFLILGRRSPLALLQDSGGRKRRGASAAEVVELSTEQRAAMAAVLSAPVTKTGKPIKGFLRRYVLRSIRRSRLRTGLALLLAALLAGAVGHLTVLRTRYGELVDLIEVDVHYFNGLSMTKARTLEKSGYLHNPVYQKFYRDAELEFETTTVCFTNRLDSVFQEPVTWLEGWDEETGMSATGMVCIIPAPIMDSMGIALGDSVRINEANCIAWLMEGYKVLPKTWDEQVALRDAHRNFYTVIGRVETEENYHVIYAPVTAFQSYSCFGIVLYLDSASFKLDNYDEANQFKHYSDQLLLTALDPPAFQMDTSDADRIYRTYRLIENIYPLMIGAALILGTVLPGLMVLQEQKEAAVLRALGWSKKLTIRRLTLEQITLCLAGLVLAVIALFAVNGSGFLGVIVVPLLYIVAHFALCVAASTAISASILQKSPMRLLQTKE
jgi:ABC-type lipoprotein release transport system permease subunit